MYTIIICPDCEYAQIVADDPETTTCGRCQSRLPFRKLKHFYDTEDSAEAKRVRATIAAQLRGKGDRFEELLGDDGTIDLDAVEQRIDAAFLSAHGLDGDAMADRTDSRTTSSRSRRDIVLDGVRECDPATEEAILDYAADHGVPREKAEAVLTKLHERGNVLVSGGTYRAV